jgi:hypothetical protein
MLSKIGMRLGTTSVGLTLIVLLASVWVVGAAIVIR